MNTIEKIEQSKSGKLIIGQDTLTDGSHVYNVYIGASKIWCMDKEAAYKLFETLDSIAYDIES